MFLLLKNGSMYPYRILKRFMELSSKDKWGMNFVFMWNVIASEDHDTLFLAYRLIKLLLNILS